MPSHVSPSVRPTDDLAAHFKRINQRLSSLERASSSGSPPSSTGTDEVWVGTADPIVANPTIELWYDSDDEPASAPGAANYWNSGGIVAVGSLLSSPSSIAANGAATITSAIPFTTAVGRRYRLVFVMRATSAPASVHVRGNIFDGATDGFNTYGDRYQMVFGAVGYQALSFQWTFDGDGAAHSYTVQLNVGAQATVTLYGNSAIAWYLEDVGPNSSPAPPIPLTPPPFTVITPFANNWVPYSAGAQAPRYRKIGDIVYLEGAVKSGTLGVAMFTLPLGFRPALARQFAQTSWATVAGITINPDGTVVSTSGGDNRYLGTEAVFSVTP